MKNRYKYTIWEVVEKLKQRVSFYGLYRIFDKFEQFRVEKDVDRSTTQEQLDKLEQTHSKSLETLQKQFDQKLKEDQKNSLKLVSYIIKLVDQVTEQQE